MKSSTAAKRKMTVKERQKEVRRQRTILGIVVLCALLYLLVSFWFVFHFMPKSTVNGVSVGGLSYRKAAETMQSAEEQYELSVRGPGGKTETISGSDLELQITDASGLKKAMRKQGAFGWPVRIFMNKKYTAELVVSHNSANLERDISSLEMLKTSNMTAPVDAHLDINADCEYYIVPESDGTTLDTDAAKQQIRDAVEAGLPEVDLTKSQVLPDVLSDDANLKTRESEWNAYIACAGLTYHIADTKETLTPANIAGVLTDDGEHVTADEKKIARLMAAWKDEHDTYGKSFTFTKHDGTTTKIDHYGDYGWSLDEETTGADVKEKLDAGDTGTYTCSYYHEPLFTENGGLGGTYVEVSIYDQHLWAYKDGECVVDTDVVTGRPVHGAITYLGCYSIKRKDTQVTLGEEDVQGYEQPVNWWVPFNGGEGFHDAPWRDRFGGKIWIENGSHGCVNVPENVMESLFNNVEVGEAVVIWGNDYDEEVNDVSHTEVNEDYYYDVYYGSNDS